MIIPNPTETAEASPPEFLAFLAAQARGRTADQRVCRCCGGRPRSRCARSPHAAPSGSSRGTSREPSPLTLPGSPVWLGSLGRPLSWRNPDDNPRRTEER